MVRPLKLLIVIISLVGGIIAGYKHGNESEPAATVLPDAIAQPQA